MTDGLPSRLRRVAVPVNAVFRPFVAQAPDATDVFCNKVLDESGDEMGGMLARSEHFDIRGPAYPLAFSTESHAHAGYAASPQDPVAIHSCG